MSPRRLGSALFKTKVTATMPLKKWMKHVQAKCQQVEGELRKHPDFQLYLITRSPKDRARMERLLMGIPSFRLWRALTDSLGRAAEPARNREDRAPVAGPTSVDMSPGALS